MSVKQQLGPAERMWLRFASHSMDTIGPWVRANLGEAGRLPLIGLRLDELCVGMGDCLLLSRLIEGPSVSVCVDRRQLREFCSEALKITACEISSTLQDIAIKSPEYLDLDSTIKSPANVHGLEDDDLVWLAGELDNVRHPSFAGPIREAIKRETKARDPRFGAHCAPVERDNSEDIEFPRAFYAEDLRSCLRDCVILHTVAGERPSVQRFALELIRTVMTLVRPKLERQLRVA